MKMSIPAESGSASATSGLGGSAFIDAKIDQLADWRGKTLAKVRELIR